MSAELSLPVPERASTTVERVENGFSALILAMMVVLPVFAVTFRWITGVSFAGANLWVQSLNLWLTFAGGALAARAGRHLSLSTGEMFKVAGKRRFYLDAFTSSVGAMVTAALAYASVELTISETGSTMTLPGGVPMWVMQTIMPIGFMAIALRLAWYGNRSRGGRALALLSIGLFALLALVPPGEREWVVWGGSGVILGAVALGAPLFTAMGGVAMLLFYGAPIPISISAVPSETYRIVASPMLPSLPLFTLAGYVLAEGGSSKRMIRLFSALFGWLPGGVAAAAVLVSAFFTTFTGASGVTILALGGLLLPVLEAAGYPRRFAVGLLVASGSIGLLFPPSLPVILYGVASQVPITDLFIGGAVPGVILVVLIIGMAVAFAIVNPPAGEVAVVARPFGAHAGEWLREAWASLWRAGFEVFLPVFVLSAIFGGLMTIFEAAAFTAAYALFTEVVIHRDLHPTRDLPRVFTETAVLMGGVLIILGVALGFTSYLVDAEVPLLVSAWVEARVENQLVFILLLNIILLGVGSMMDIYSAIMVVVPLIVPIAEVFGMNPVHLGVLFLANLELGYLTPPVGINLFLASFRFEMPLTKVYRLVLPFLGVLLLGVLLISYVPWLTTWALEPSSGEQAPDFFSDEPAALPLGAMDLDSLLEEGGDPSRPLGELDLDALLNAPAPPADPSKPLGDLDLDALLQEVEVPVQPPSERDLDVLLDQVEAPAQ
ncbi:MAG: TRAP transporter large permease subunit [Deltaproteobacteria bacterium]|nr:TRAP transporter large permease subunit [Deltaproteobacteria bacterium]